MNRPAILVASFVAALIALVTLSPKNTPTNVPPEQFVSPIHYEETIAPQPIQISNKSPGYLPYSGIITQLKKWNKEAPAITEFGTYGESSQGVPLTWLRVGEGNKKVLITAAIHGNEPLSTSTVMAFIGNLLDGYGKNDEITNLIDNREIYFIPVVCPDSYPKSRYVDGTDPNRNFLAKNPVTPIKCLKDFFLEKKFNAAMSCHTWGRVFLTPYGEKYDIPPNQQDYQRIIGEMCEMTKKQPVSFTEAEAGVIYRTTTSPFSHKFDPVNIANHYKTIRTCEMYSQPFSGGECDWFYKHGAFTIVMEMGLHQRIPSIKDTTTEFDMTWNAFLHFLKEAPLVEIKQ